MEKQIPLTIVTGFSLKGKNELLKKVYSNDGNKRLKVLYHDTSFTFIKNEEEPLPMTSFIGTAVHDAEVTLSNLDTWIEQQPQCDIDEIVLDIYPFTDVSYLLDSLVSNTSMYLHSHIHVIGADEFWSAYFSEHEIQFTCSETKERIIYTLGETLMSQLEMAQTVVLSNSDSLSFEEQGELTTFIQTLVPTSTIKRIDDFCWEHEKRETTFELKGASYLYTQQVDLFESRNDIPIIGHYGIDTYVFKSIYPVDFPKLEQFFSKLPNEVFRMKGTCYNPSLKESYIISQVGSSVQVNTYEVDLLPLDGVLSEFLFIGAELDRVHLKNCLDFCLHIPENTRYLG
ncbi:GTP-binding protein [Halalkalibacter nanhaiisediminis]|uniref:G3E family GTPase n=1 Tax=Halalkalibacter nanhaiisediminis TaxID=688079 RepID=A0A562QV75_9BACI|nr:GTP-binding protein [Halalkalibacter nanhaiisediminis]TWI60036.1 G3E family GTPase [Halalkalibacter nanhaiisediminis]